MLNFSLENIQEIPKDPSIWLDIRHFHVIRNLIFWAKEDPSSFVYGHYLLLRGRIVQYLSPCDILNNIRR